MRAEATKVSPQPRPVARAESHSPAPGRLLQRQCACGASAGVSGTCSQCSDKRLQRKLTIGSSHDPLELEADRVADQVMRAPSHDAVTTSPPRIQRFSGHADGGGQQAPASVDRVLSGAGRPLEPGLRLDMERRFGHDFSNVRVHSGVDANASARDVDANAYTVGQDIVFGADRYEPRTHAGRRLLAHELTHVVQQSGAERTLRRLTVGPGSRASLKDDATSTAAAERIEPFRRLPLQVGLDSAPAFEVFQRLREADYALFEYRETVDLRSAPLIPALGLVLSRPPAPLSTTASPTTMLGAGAVIGIGIVAVESLVRWISASGPARTQTNGEAAKRLADALSRLADASRRATARQAHTDVTVLAEDLPAEAKRKGCSGGPRHLFLDPDFKRPAFNNWYAETWCRAATKTDYEYVVVAPDGRQKALFDGKKGAVVFECKCGYESLRSLYEFGTKEQEKALRSWRRIEIQLEKHLAVANACGLRLVYKVSSAALAEKLATYPGVSVDTDRVEGVDTTNCAP